MQHALVDLRRKAVCGDIPPVLNHPPLESLPITGRRPPRHWLALGASVVVHALLAGLIVLLAQRSRDAMQTVSGSTSTAPSLQTVTLAPFILSRPRPVVPARPEAETKRPERPIPLPQVQRGAENIPLEAPRPEPSPPAPPVPDPGTRTDAPSGAPAAASEVASAVPSLESETERLFGRRNSVAGSGGGAEPVVRWNNGPTEQRDNDCRPRPVPPRRPGEPIALEFVEGRVYDDRTHVPLGGAHLQIMGTPYTTFADDAGHYRLGFDPALVDECRSQYVRVIARGVPPQLIVLGRGPGGTDIYLRP